MSHANAAAATRTMPVLRSWNADILRLTFVQALAGANSAVVYATGAIVGHMLAPSPALATLPISIFVVGMAACTLPAGAIARRYGRRAAFLMGTGCGVTTLDAGGRSAGSSLVPSAGARVGQLPAQG